MCDKLPYNNPRIDKCLLKEIEEKSTGKIFEFFTKIELGPRKRNRYYKKDNEGLYYIPELI